MHLLKDYASFNRWANAKMVNWLQTKPLELMEREAPSSFPNLQLTLLHIWSAEKIWLERLQAVPLTTFLAQTFSGTTADVFEGLLAMSQQFEEYVCVLSEADLQETIGFRLLNGTEDSRPRHHMIHHCLNHSTYHRGQIVTIARSLGITDPPATDFIQYLRQK
jgi:uncharacterized damage-inducible protein DinB